MKESITFILPTRNRKDYVARAIDSCLASQCENISVRVMVIDASSDSTCVNMLRERYAGQQAVEILVQPPEAVGFMGACFFAVERLESRYATFMYDDDVLSPYISEMYQRMVNKSCPFAMGFGQTNNADQVLEFRPVTNWGRPRPWDLLLAWFGNTRWQYRAMPVSPVCCLATSDVLKRWMVEVRQFAAANDFRQHYIMRRNIGGDLMIYLHCIIDAQQEILLANQVVAQWSEHPNSMTVLAEDLDLFAGYWLARCWAVGYCAQSGDMGKAARMAGYVVVSGMAAALRSRRIGKTDLARSIVAEIRQLSGMVGLARLALQVGVATTSIAVGRFKRHYIKARNN